MFLPSDHFALILRARTTPPPPSPSTSLDLHPPRARNAPLERGQHVEPADGARGGRDGTDAAAARRDGAGGGGCGCRRLEPLMQETEYGGLVRRDVMRALGLSLIQVPADLEKYVATAKAPLLINSCEVDPQFPTEKQAAADKIFAGFAPGYKRLYFEGCTHGFAVRMIQTLLLDAILLKET
ncbi:hypothetical protein C8R44DRAFT_734851 [Mycena epipterygia]|nr:hypothetical protein C8R44DRAFT_734851 [Mycena epipterygia]